MSFQPNIKNNLYRTVVILVLLACFGIQVKEGLVKFIKGQTTVATSTEFLEEAELPVLSFCPGYKHDHYVEQMEYLVLLLENNASESEITEWWRIETFNVQDIIEGIKKPGAWAKTDYTLVNGTGFYEELNVDIKTVSSSYGRCYSIYFHNSLKSEFEFYTVKFKMATADMTIYLHEEGNEVGAIFSYWPLDPSTVMVKETEQYTINIQKDEYTPKMVGDMLPCHDDNSYSYPQCVTKWIRTEYFETFDRYNKTTCWHPIGQYIVGKTDDIHLCSTVKMEDFAHKTIYKLVEMSVNQKKTQCPNRCHQNVWKVDTTRDPSDGNNVGTALIVLKNSMVTNHIEDVTIFDFNAVVASVGGSLGLFLGVSCLSMLTALGRMVTESRHMKRRRANKNPKENKDLII